MIILLEAGRDPALLVSDICLNGDMPGSQLAKFARQLFPNIKVIMTSGKEWPVLSQRHDLPAQAMEAARAHPRGQAGARVNRGDSVV